MTVEQYLQQALQNLQQLWGSWSPSGQAIDATAVSQQVSQTLAIISDALAYQPPDQVKAPEPEPVPPPEHLAAE